jgi:hypothetical protein
MKEFYGKSTDKERGDVFLTSNAMNSGKALDYLK